MAGAVEQLSGVRPMIVGPGVKTGMNILAEIHNQLGADIVASSVAAIQKYPQPTIVRTNKTDRILLFIALILSVLSTFYGWRSWVQYSIGKGALWGNFKNGKFRSKISNLSRKNHSLETRQNPLTMSRGCCFIMVAVYFFGRLRSWFFW